MSKLNVVYTQCPENLDRFKLTYWYEGEPRPGPQFYMLRRGDNDFVALGRIERSPPRKAGRMCWFSLPSMGPPPPGVMAVLPFLPRFERG